MSSVRSITPKDPRRNLRGTSALTNTWSDDGFVRLAAPSLQIDHDDVGILSHGVKHDLFAVGGDVERSHAAAICQSGEQRALLRPQAKDRPRISGSSTLHIDQALAMYRWRTTPPHAARSDWDVISYAPRRVPAVRATT